MAYSVDLFIGDVGFTSDYSNVLHFATENDRYVYFNRLDKYTIENTNYNNIKMDTSSLKIAFTNQSRALHFDEISYCKISTEYRGDTGKSLITKYYFVTGYNIISSSENLTVVEFGIELDIWQNYQFGFKLKECNVDRCHMDRWTTDGKIKYTRPTQDKLESYISSSASEELVDKVDVYAIETTPDTHRVLNRVEIALVVITYTDNNSVSYLFFPITLDNTEIYAQYLNGERHRFPTLSEFTSNSISSKFGLTSSAIVNIQILFHSGITINNVEHGNLYYENVIAGSTGAYGYSILQDTDESPTSNWMYSLNAYSPEQVPWRFTEAHDITITKPEKPVDGADYNEKYEPMLYREPVMKRVITNGDASEIFEIPDNRLQELIDNHKVYFKTIVSATTSYNIASIKNPDDNIPEESVISAVAQLSGYAGDVINSYWIEYCQTQREADRTMMWGNILTGGLAEAGSTAVSAGIGYRSNMERSEMHSIQTSSLGAAMRNMSLSTNSLNMLSSQKEIGASLSEMYKKYAGQAMGMSAIGGATAFGANAISKLIGQEAKEKAIRNKPAQLTKNGNWFGLLSAGSYKSKYIEYKCDDASFELYKNIYMKYGYSISTVMKPDIYSRKYFNYIKTNGAIVTGKYNQSILAKLATIFDNGVTIWHMDYTTKETLYTYTKENIERSLMTNE